MSYKRLLFWPNLSISTRLTLWYGLTLLVLLSFFAFFCYTTFHVGLHRDFDRHLVHERRELQPLIQIQDERPRFASLGRARSVAYRTDGIYGTYVRLLTTEGEVLYQSPNFQGHAPLSVKLPDTPRGAKISRDWEAKPARTHYAPLLDGQDRLQGWLEVTGFEWSLHRELRRLGWTLALGIVLSVLLAIGGGYLLARRALRPVAALTKAANQIEASDLEARLPVRKRPHDELTELAETFNCMIDRLERSFERERRFTANAAHELLTPLATLRNEVEVVLRRERNSDEYRDVLRSALHDTNRMSRIVRGLLHLSHAERQNERPSEPINLGQLGIQRLDRIRRQADADGIALDTSTEPDVRVAADSERLAEAVDNLLDNALKYTSEGGRITLRVDGDAREARLTVSDTGAGFDPEEADRLFDRFYRADAPEVQAEPGSGLGLAIVQAIVRAYGGSITARSTGRQQGSTFEVRLPRLEKAP